MKVIHKPKETVTIFDRLQFFKEDGKEGEKLQREITHPLRLFLLKQLNINPIISSFYKRFNLSYIKEVSVSQIENYKELSSASLYTGTFVKKHLSLIDELKEIEGQKVENGKHVEKIEKKNVIHEKIKTHLIKFDYFNNEPKKKVAFYNGCIEYFNWLLETNPTNNTFLSTLNLLKKEKNTWESLIVEKEKDPKEYNTDLPYKIALLNEIGFFDLPAVKNMTKTNQRHLIKTLIGGTDRQLKGNINVLNPNSLDDRTRYTSGQYEKAVKQYISSLYNN